MDFVIEVTGGIGKHIMATSLVKWINEKYPDSKIIVVSAYPEVFEMNPRVYRNLHLMQPYLFEDYIKGKDFRKGEPYSIIDYYRDENKKHLMYVMPKAYGFNEYNENPETELYLTKGDEEGGRIFNENNPRLLTIQVAGGVGPGMNGCNKDKIDNSQRDLEFQLSIKVTNELMRKGYRLLQIRTKQERELPGCIQLDTNFRNLFAISKYSKGHVGIDSSMMHTAASLKKPMLIFWGGTHMDNLGYKYDGVFNAYNDKAMHCRPHIQMHDRTVALPYFDKNNGREFEYSDKELREHIEKFISFLQK